MKVWSGYICLRIWSGADFRKYGSGNIEFHKWRRTFGPTKRLLGFRHFLFCAVQFNCYSVISKYMQFSLKLR